MYTVEKIDRYPDFQALAPIWDSLLMRSDCDNIFLSYAWLDSWWTVFGTEYDLYILIVKSGEEIVGIAPLMRSRQHIIQFIGTPNADYSDIIGPDKHSIIGLIYDYLTNHTDDWRRIELQQIPERISTVEGFQAAFSSGEFPYSIEVMETCTVYKYDGPEEKRPDFILRRNKTMRNNINFFIRTGGLDLVRIQNPDEIEKYLPAFFHEHIVRWDSTPTPSKFLEEKHRKFYHTIVRNLASRGQISLLLLLHKNRPIAYFFTYDYKNVLYLYTTAFDLFFVKRSPGLILINMMTSLFVQLGYTLIDHTRGAEGYKRHFTNTTYQNYRLIIYKQKSDLRRAHLVGRLKRLIPIDLINKNRKLANLKVHIATNLYTHGAVNFLKKLAKKFLRILFDYRVMHVMEHTGPPPKDFTLPSGTTIEIVGEDDIELIAAFLGFEPDSRKHQVIQRRFADGGECFIARYNGTIASIAWGMFKEDYLTDVGKRFPLMENEVDLGDDFTSPVFRGLGLHPILIAYRVRRYAEKNHRILSTILSDNIASLKGYRKNGFVPVASIRSLKIFGIKIL